MFAFLSVKTEKENDPSQVCASNIYMTLYFSLPSLSEKRRYKRKMWTEEEKQCIWSHFPAEMISSGLPGKAEILAVLHSEPVLHKRTWQNVKDFIRNNQAKK